MHANNSKLLSLNFRRRTPKPIPNRHGSKHRSTPLDDATFAVGHACLLHAIHDDRIGLAGTRVAVPQKLQVQLLRNTPADELVRSAGRDVQSTSG